MAIQLPAVVQSQLDKHDQEIAGLRADIHGVRSDLGQISGAMSDIKAFMLSSQANKPLPAVQTIQLYLSIATSIGVLAAMLVAGIVYVSSNANSGEMALMRYKIDRFERDARPSAR